MSHLDLTREWLGNVLRPYPSRDKISAEVMKILAERKTLSVKTDAFTFNSGQTALLLLLHGTLPITYRGATYHIPMHVWVPHEYPRSPPMAFVVPTKEMGVRKGREVDPSGRVREEVVEEWWRTGQMKDLESLLQTLASIFSATPPVYAKPPDQSAAQPPPASPAQSSRSVGPAGSATGAAPGSPAGIPVVPNRPAAGVVGSGPPVAGRPYSALQQENLPQYRPAPTPPPQAFAPGSHSRQSSATFPAQIPPGAPPQHPASPVIPNRPGRIPQPQPQPQSPGSIGEGGAPVIPQRPYVPHSHNQSSVTPGMSQGYPGQGSPITAARPIGNMAGAINGWQKPTIAPGQPGYTSPGPEQNVTQFQPYHQSQQQPQGYSYPSQQAPAVPAHPHIAASTQPPVLTRSPEPQPATAAPPTLAPAKQPIQDLLSSPEPTSVELPSDAAPPLPPSKPPPPSLLHLHSILLPHLQASLPPLLNSLHSTKTHLLERREDLVSGEPAIRDEMARLEAVRKVCDSTGKKLGEVVHAGEERVTELEGKGETSVDELVCGISIVHNQLIDLVAEDNAIEDTIYHMTRALDAERVDLDRYLKSIRLLAREQYMKRALIERILSGMGQKQGW
ncbi:ESCRT-I complex subunit TSG101 [Kwoniella heveanensis CBS 569]|nr:ESCRT-I complex subunit TSG101 [Kwoniella heveanensis CBS 569]